MGELFNGEELAFARAVSRLAYCNPFLPERISCEREILGGGFDESDADWNVRAGSFEERPNLVKIIGLVEERLDAFRLRLVGGKKGTADEQALYGEMAIFLVYHRYYERLQATIEAGEKGKRIDYYPEFRAEMRRFFELKGVSGSAIPDIPHLFACFFQVRRAFHHIFSCIIGSAAAATKLRANIWQSIFTHDLRNYQKGLYQVMGDMTTLITGPTGTGKELAARAIALSRYIPFDEKTGRFAEDFSALFLPLNLSALSPTLIESELFGHRKGAFTGALQDRAGWFETCPPCGTVFLDEIGEVDPAIQVKLLRVLQERTFQRLGETETRRFRGKIIAATNRDLAREMAEGRFRRDFFYRLCADVIATPALAEQVRGSRDEMVNLVSHLVGRHIGEGEKDLVTRTVRWIERELGKDYPWPGNIRELEQCIRSILIRNEYRPPAQQILADPAAALAKEMIDGTLSADELLSRYCRIVFDKTGSYVETAKKLDLDRRTVKSRVDKKEG